MKILHLLSGGGIGGIEMLCQNIAELNRGENEFCFLYSGGSIAEEMKQSGVPVYLYFREKLVLRMFKLWLLVKRQKYDVIIVHHEGIGIYLFYLMLIRCYPHIKFIKYLHCSFEEKYFYQGNKVTDWLNYHILKNALLKSDCCIAVSEFVKKSYCDEFRCDAKSVKVVYNGIKCAKQSKNYQERIEAKSGVCLLFIGRLTEVKGVHHLLYAVRRLVTLGEDVVLEVLGDGPQRQEYEQLSKELGIEEKVFFEGNQLRKQKFYDEAEIFVYPSIWQEAFGISIVEALAQGLICVASDVGGIPEIVTDGGNGFLFTGGSIDALTEVLLKALQICRDEERREKIRTEAKKTADSFDIQKTAETLRNICRELL